MLAFNNLGPISATSFIEDVVHHTHGLGLRVENMVSLGALGIPDEDSRMAAIIKLPHVIAHATPRMGSFPVSSSSAIG